MALLLRRLTLDCPPIAEHDSLLSFLPVLLTNNGRHQRKRCFRCGLANHTPDKCKYKDFECFNCHLTGHSLSVAMQNHHQKRWRADKMNITLNRIQKLDCRRTCEMNFSGPFHIFTAGHCRTDCMRWTMAAVCIYARYFPVIFLALFTSASILVDFSRLYKFFHLEEATLRVHQGSFSRLKRKLFLLRLVCLWAQHEYLCFSIPVKLT